MAGRPIGPGAAPVVAASGTASFVTVPVAAADFWVVASAAAWIDVRDNNTADSLAAADANALAANVVYGPFHLMRGVDKYIAVAGNGAGSTITITFGT